LGFSSNAKPEAGDSLEQIFKALKIDGFTHSDKHGSLKTWAKQGVLMLDAVMTVKERFPGSHMVSISSAFYS